MGVPVMAMRYLARSEQMALLALVVWFLMRWASSRIMRFHLILARGLSWENEKDLLLEWAAG
jgi:hypothetical protein